MTSHPGLASATLEDHRLPASSLALAKDAQSRLPQGLDAHTKQLSQSLRAVQVIPIPGPSAFLAALVASGLPTDVFTFCGYLPARREKRRQALGGFAGACVPCGCACSQLPA